jgi:hypothetical protein
MMTRGTVSLNENGRHLRAGRFLSSDRYWFCVCVLGSVLCPPLVDCGVG